MDKLTYADSTLKIQSIFLSDTFIQSSQPSIKTLYMLYWGLFPGLMPVYQGLRMCYICRG